MESNFDKTSKAYKANNKSKVLEKLRKSIISEQTNNKESAMNIDVKKLPEEAENPNEAAKLIKKMDKMIKISKNDILIIAYKQGKIFRKFKTNNRFISAVSAFKISKATISFKIAIVDFIGKYPRMEKSCISLYNLKNNFKIIKEVCQENASEFQY